MKTEVEGRVNGLRHALRNKYQLLNASPTSLEWHDLSYAEQLEPGSGFEVYARIKQFARDDLESGERAADPDVRLNHITLIRFQALSYSLHFGMGRENLKKEGEYIMATCNYPQSGPMKTVLDLQNWTPETNPDPFNLCFVPLKPRRPAQDGELPNEPRLMDCMYLYNGYVPDGDISCSDLLLLPFSSSCILLLALRPGAGDC